MVPAFKSVMPKLNSLNRYEFVSAAAMTTSSESLADIIGVPLKVIVFPVKTGTLALTNDQSVTFWN